MKKKHPKRYVAVSAIYNKAVLGALWDSIRLSISFLPSSSSCTSEALSRVDVDEDGLVGIGKSWWEDVLDSIKELGTKGQAIADILESSNPKYD